MEKTKLIFKYCTSFIATLLGGALVGLCISIFVNNALVEISINPAFAIVFGAALISMGTLISYRVCRKRRQENEKLVARAFLICFATFVVLAGIFCFFLDVAWFNLAPGIKIPMYSALGIALWFAFAFITLDILNYISHKVAKCFSSKARVTKRQALISSPAQIWAVLSVTILLGCYYGIIFGIYDVASNPNKLGAETFYTTPIGIAFSAAFSVVNRYYLSETIGKDNPEKYFEVYDGDDGI